MSRRTAPLVLRSVDVRPQSVGVAPSRRRHHLLRRLVGVVAMVLLAVVGLAPAAAAEPGDPEDPELEDIIFEGGTKEMREQLDAAQIAWLDAKVALDASVARQQELATILDTAEGKIAEQTAQLGKVSYIAFISAGQVTLATIVNDVSADDMLDAMGIVDAQATEHTELINSLRASQEQARAAQVGIDDEIATQNALLSEMDARKQQAQLALCQVAAGCPAESNGVFTEAASAVAVAAPRNPDGSWPEEYIPRDRAGYPYEIERDVTGHPQRPDPITPRLAHLIRQAKGAGFTRYVTCFRHEENGGQHPRGRACDFGLGASGSNLPGAVQGTGKEYGDQLAAFLVFNAERLGVLIVVWYRQIWQVSTGRWKYYSGSMGDPSSDHTNHVHVSVR